MTSESELKTSGDAAEMLEIVQQSVPKPSNFPPSPSSSTTELVSMALVPATDAHVTKNPDEFTFFPSFAPELRTMIWKQTISPRLVLVTDCWTFHPEEYLKVHALPCAISQVCKESRKIFLANYEVCSYKHSSCSRTSATGHFYIDFSRDVISLAGNLERWTTLGSNQEFLCKLQRCATHVVFSQYFEGLQSFCHLPKWKALKCLEMQHMDPKYYSQSKSVLAKTSRRGIDICFLDETRLAELENMTDDIVRHRLQWA